MNTELIKKCDLLVENRDIMSGVFVMEGNSMLLTGSSLYVGAGALADPEKLKACKQIIKKNDGIFSEFNGHARIAVVCKMALAEDAERCFEDLHSILDLMKEQKWINMDYQVLAALTIYDHAEASEYQKAVQKMTDLYKSMREKHPWLTHGEDLPFAAMLACSDLDTDILSAEMESCYQELTRHFYDKDAAQSLSHVLAVDTAETAEKCGRVEALWNLLKEKGHRYSMGPELSVLGTLCMLDLSVDAITDEIIEADEYLKTKQGFGFLMGEKARRMYAALMVMDTHMPPASRSHESLLDSTIALEIAMEMCMIIMMTNTSVMISTSH